MAKPAIPHVSIGGGGGEGGAPRLVITEERIEVAGASGDHDDFPGAKVLHKKTKRVKLYRARIIFGKLTNGNKAGSDVRGEKNIT